MQKSKFNSLNKWVNKAKSKLDNHCTPEEDLVYFNLPIELKLEAIRQKKLIYGNHIYFVDIYLPIHRIAIEVDGGYHKQSTIHDKERDGILLSHGIKTLRIANEDVLDKYKLKSFMSDIYTLCYS